MTVFTMLLLHLTGGGKNKSVLYFLSGQIELVWKLGNLL